MIDGGKLNEIVKDHVIDLRAYRMAMVHIIKGELIIGSLVFSNVNIPFMMFNLNRFMYLGYLCDIDRHGVASRILEEL